MQDLGLGWIKQKVRWEHVERSDDSYGWGDEGKMAKSCIIRGDWSPRPAYDAVKTLPK